MGWDVDPAEDIEDTFLLLSGVPDTDAGGWQVEGRAPDTVEVRARRERRRAAKMEADPEYAERRREQARRSQKKRRDRERAERVRPGHLGKYTCSVCGETGHDRRVCGVGTQVGGLREEETVEREPAVELVPVLRADVAEERGERSRRPSALRRRRRPRPERDVSAEARDPRDPTLRVLVEQAVEATLRAIRVRAEEGAPLPWDADFLLTLAATVCNLEEHDAGFEESPDEEE